MPTKPAPSRLLPAPGNLAFLGSAALLACLLAPGRVPATTLYVGEPQLESCRQWQDAEHALRDGSLGGREAKRAFESLISTLRQRETPAPRKLRWQWVFPLPGYGMKNVDRFSYHATGYRFLAGPKRKGSPGVDLYAYDWKRDGLDDRTGKPIPVVSATDGLVVSTQPYWSAQDSNPEGVYVQVLNQEQGRFFFYTHLSRLKVGLGELVAKGQILGWLGRTGADLQKHRATHLHFEVHDYAGGLFYPVKPFYALKLAKHLAWPLPPPDYSKPAPVATPAPPSRPAARPGARP